jgi:hypothetical protein
VIEGGGLDQSKTVRLRDLRRQFSARARTGLFVDKHAVLAPLVYPDIEVINRPDRNFRRGLTATASGEAASRGESMFRQGRLSIQHARRWLYDAVPNFPGHGVASEKHVICYCGCGNSTTIVHQLGFCDLSLYHESRLSGFCRQISQNSRCGLLGHMVAKPRWVSGCSCASHRNCLVAGGITGCCATASRAIGAGGRKTCWQSVA